MTTSNAGKYRAIVAAISLFVFFIVSVLAINFYLSTKIGADATKVNLAGRQRTLSQQMTKSLLLMDIALAKGQDIDKPLAELKSAHAFFDKTLTGFTNGGMVTAPDGNLIILEQVITERGMMLLFDTRKEWDPVNRALRKITAFNGYPYDDTAAQKLGQHHHPSNRLHGVPHGAGAPVIIILSQLQGVIHRHAEDQRHHQDGEEMDLKADQGHRPRQPDQFRNDRDKGEPTQPDAAEMHGEGRQNGENR